MANQANTPVRRALISVSDKTGIVEFGRALTERGIELLSTGGTFRLLQENQVPVTEVSDYTGFPEMLAGRAKTLHPKIQGGSQLKDGRSKRLNSSKVGTRIPAF